MYKEKVFFAENEYVRPRDRLGKQRDPIFFNDTLYSSTKTRPTY